jgi:hypothetical protein
MAPALAARMRNSSPLVATTLGALFVLALAWVIAHFATVGLAIVLVLMPAPFALFWLYLGLDTHAPAFLERAAGPGPVARPAAPEPPGAARPAHAH